MAEGEKLGDEVPPVAQAFRSATPSPSKKRGEEKALVSQLFHLKCKKYSGKSKSDGSFCQGKWRPPASPRAMSWQTEHPRQRKKDEKRGIEGLS
jgi:hypothetical protein